MSSVSPSPSSAHRELVVAYTRVSTAEQQTDGHSLETQRQFLEDFASGHGLKVVRWFEETHSAYRPGRPQFDAMLSFLTSRPDITKVLVYKLDRLWRNEADYGALSSMDNVRLLSATERIPDGATGRFMTTMLTGMARFSSDQTSERVIHAARQKVRQGGWPGPAPTGYVNDRDTKSIEQDPTMAHIVQAVFETYAREDVSLSQLVSRAKRLGLRTRAGGTMQKGALHKMLTNPFYCGTVTWDGLTYPGTHEPIISRVLFNRVQDRLQGKSSPLTKRKYAYRGLMHCAECGCKITASLIKGKYIYYHCTNGRGGCKKKSYSEDTIGALFGDVVSAIALSEEQTRFLLEQITGQGKRLRSERDKLKLSLERDRRSTELLRSNAYEDKLLGKISEERWLQLDAKWEEKLIAIDEQLRRVLAGDGPAVDEAEATFKLLQRARELYSQKSHEERVPLLKMLLSNSYLGDGKLDPVYEKPFDLVAEGLDRHLWLPG